MGMKTSMVVVVGCLLIKIKLINDLFIAWIFYIDMRILQILSDI